jgi:hypothetical protein
MPATDTVVAKASLSGKAGPGLLAAILILSESSASAKVLGKCWGSAGFVRSWTGRMHETESFATHCLHFLGGNHAGRFATRGGKEEVW